MNLNTVSDKIVFSILKDIKVGHLELTNYDGKNYSFGNIKQIHKFSGLLDLSFINYLKSIFVKNTKNRSKIFIFYLYICL